MLRVLRGGRTAINRAVAITSRDVAKVGGTAQSRWNGNQPFDTDRFRTDAEELVNRVPIVVIEEPVAVCDGGGGALGHPVEYIAVEPGQVSVCKYCSVRFTRKDEHH